MINHNKLRSLAIRLFCLIFDAYVRYFSRFITVTKSQYRAAIIENGTLVIRNDEYSTVIFVPW